MNQFILPFLLTLLAGLSTVLGSLIFLSKAFVKENSLVFFLDYLLE